jgi:hypothetical protein
VSRLVWQRRVRDSSLELDQKQILRTNQTQQCP